MTKETHTAEGSEPAVCSGQRAANTFTGAGARERAARNQMDAAEGSGPTASCARRLHTSADDVELGSPDADRAPPCRCDGGVTPVAVSSLNLAPAVSDGRRGLSREAFVAIATPLLAKGATWREVAEACGLSWRAAKGRGEHYGLQNVRGPGRPMVAAHSPETRARIRETLRRRWLEGRR